MTENIAPDPRELKKDLEKNKKDINKILTNDLVHIQKEMKNLQENIKKLQPRTSSFYLGLLFIIFIIIISYINLSFNFALGVTVVSIIPFLMCVYAIIKLRK